MAWLDAMGNHWWPSYPCTISQWCISQGRLTLRWTPSPGLCGTELAREVGRVILDTTMEACIPLEEICTHSTMVAPNFQEGRGTTRQQTKESVPKQMTPADWVEAQMQDPDLSQIICLYKIKRLQTAKLDNFESREIKTLLHHWYKLTLQEGMLYLQTAPNQDDQNDLRLVLPQVYHAPVMHGCHDDLGHLGTEHMLDLLCDQFYCPTMQDNVDWYLRGCDWCKWFKAYPQQEELCPILAMYPLELLHIDFLIIENPKTEKDINVLVIADHFTWYVQATVTTSQTARATAKALWNAFFIHYRFPASILNDQVWNSERYFIKELCDLGVFENSSQPLIIHREMGSANYSIPLNQHDQNVAGWGQGPLVGLCPYFSPHL